MKRPLIGITPYNSDESLPHRFGIACNYMESVLRAGGLPVILPFVTASEEIAPYLELCDGFLLSGGVDIDPALYGEEKLEACGTVSKRRDAFEMAFIPAALSCGKPILGICRGVQSLNVVLGGSLYQDINTQFPITAEHRMQEPVNVVGHAVKIVAGTPLEAIGGKDQYMVNSYHHQAVKKLGKGLEIMAYSEDGLIEGVYMPARKFVLGVQWHPERISEVDEQAQGLFAAFVDACRE